MNKDDLIINHILKELDKYLLKDIVEQNDQLGVLKYYKGILQNRLDTLDKDTLNNIGTNGIINLCINIDREFLNSSAEHRIEIINSQNVLYELEACKSLVYNLAREYHTTKKLPNNYNKQKEEVLSKIKYLEALTINNAKLHKLISDTIPDLLLDLEYALGNSAYTSLSFKQYIVSDKYKGV